MKKQSILFNAMVLTICMSIYFSVRVFRQFPLSVQFPFIRGHLNDLLAPAVLLAVGGLLGTAIFHQPLIPKYRIVYLCFLCSFAWEYGAKLLHLRGVFDYIDILCYFIGGILYGILQFLFLERRSKNGTDNLSNR